MRLATDIAGVTQEIELVRSSSTATLSELLHEATGLDVPADKALWVGPRRFRASAPLEKLPLLEGTRISRTRPAEAAPAHGWTALLAGGLHAGTSVRVPTSRPLVIGRSPNADIELLSPSASWSHVTVTMLDEGVRVEDAGSTNGTWVNGDPVPAGGVTVTGEAVVVAGGDAIVLTPDLAETAAPRAGSLHNISGSGTAPFNRPPRQGRRPGPAPIEPPVRKDIPASSKFSIITVVAPLILASAMVAMMGDLRYGAIAALSPILGVGTWWESKQRRKRDLAEEAVRFDGAVEEFRGQLVDAGTVERTRLRDEVPDPATVMRRASVPTTRMWERRAGTPGFLALHAGTGDMPWQPPVDEHTLKRSEAVVKEVVREFRIGSAPVAADLSDAGVVGIVGDREGCLAVARSLVVQAATHCGPADLTIVTCCDPGREDDWSWTTWLPHTRLLGDGAGDRWLSSDRARSESLLRSLRDGIDGHTTPGVLLVLDSEVLTEGREAPARALLGHGRPVGTSSVGVHNRDPHQVSGIVVAGSVEQLPAACTTVITVGSDAEGTVVWPVSRLQVDKVVLAGLDVDTAREAAMDLAHFDDPELIVPGAALPSLVRLPPLLELEPMTAEAVTGLWTTSRGVSTPIGVGEGGTFALDLVRDGPHGLVGGTTGSGKSEFLRSLVAGLAARNSPEKLTFILIDFKGGAAFKTCERLPHTIGTVSNLDEQLADRALRALEAEMQYRQRMFAAAGEGVDNLDAYLATRPAKPMPRLLLVIDEFAMLAKDYPDVLKSLVSVAAVGRTLGVHMILATQRPAGVVNEDILANTNLRVALRVQSREDSNNVIGVAHASAIGREQRGRSYVKLGQDDITPVQTALVTGRAQASHSTQIELREVVFGRPPAPAAQPAALSDETDLDLLIDAVVEANEAAGFERPRPVWPEPLDARVDLAGFGRTDGADVPVPEVGGVRNGLVTFGLADDPDRQRQVPATWDMRRGNIMLGGIPGSGTSTALSSLALALARETAPDDLDVCVLDMGSRDLEPLERLPHTVAYVGPGVGAREKQVRLVTYLRKELERRRASTQPERPVLFILDGLAALRDEFQDYDGQAVLDTLYRVYADGPDVGIHTAFSTTRVRVLPGAMDEVTTQRWLFRLADRYDYASAGLKAHHVPPPVPGRAVGSETLLQTHVATPVHGLEAAVDAVGAAWPDAHRKASVVRSLPDAVAATELDAANLSGEPWRVPIGLRESDLTSGWLEMYEGEHALIAGPARSGKSTVLMLIAQTLRDQVVAGSPVQVWGLCSKRSPLQHADLARVGVGADDIAALVASARIHRGQIILLIDDAEQFDDTDKSLEGLLALPHVRVFAAGRSDDLRSLYSHWTKTLRKARCGLLLQPDIDYDGDLLGVRLPRKSLVAMTPGRGYLCASGTAALVQAATPA